MAVENRSAWKTMTVSSCIVYNLHHTLLTTEVFSCWTSLLRWNNHGTYDDKDTIIAPGATLRLGFISNYIFNRFSMDADTDFFRIRLIRFNKNKTILNDLESTHTTKLMMLLTPPCSLASAKLWAWTHSVRNKMVVNLSAAFLHSFSIEDFLNFN